MAFSFRNKLLDLHRYCLKKIQDLQCPVLDFIRLAALNLLRRQAYNLLSAFSNLLKCTYISE